MNIEEHNKKTVAILIKQGVNRDFKKIEQTYGKIITEAVMNEFVEHSTNHRASIEGCGYCKQQEEK